MAHIQRMGQGRAAREISYSGSAGSRPGRVVVRLIEDATGRHGLIRRARGYERELAEGHDLWEVMCRRYGIGLEVAGGSIDGIPATGPVVVVANHPYGILDGLTMARILSERRLDGFRIMAHKVFARVPELQRVILPVDFDGTPEAVARNLAMRAEALRHLGSGGIVGVFPGGTVSTAARPMGVPIDPRWRTFTARMIARSGAAVVPLFFEGHNSRVFQVASHLHATLRLGLLLREFRARIGTAVRVVVGEPVAPDRLEALRGDPQALMDLLRAETYRLSPGTLPTDALGHEFEPRWRPRPSVPQAVTP